MENHTMDIDLCMSLMNNISEASGGKSGYDSIIEMISEMAKTRESSWPLISVEATVYIVQISATVAKMVADAFRYLGFGVINSLLMIAFLYFGYRLLIKPYNYVQHFLISATDKKRDMINLQNRLRKIGTKVPPPFPNGWFALLESSDLKLGEVKQVDCLGENFAVFRTLDGNVHITEAYCPHLGASFATGGVVKDECIECPFHKWKFDSNTGKCVSIPNLENVPRGINVKVWDSKEVNDIIFVWYDKEERSPDWCIPPVEEIKSGSWIYHARNEFFVSCHVQDIPENGADVAHLNAIHADNLMCGKSLPTVDSWNIFGLHEWDAKWESTDVPHVAKVALKHEIKLFNSFTFLKIDVDVTQIGPGIVQLRMNHRFGNAVFLQCVTPLEPLLQKVIHRIYAPWYMRPIANWMMWGETVMVNRDVEIWNMKMFVNNPQLAKTDKSIKAFRNWYQQFYSPNSLSFKEAILGPKKDLIDW